MVSKHNLPAVSAIGKQGALSIDFVMNYTLPYKRVRTFTVIYLVILDNNEYTFIYTTKTLPVYSIVGKNEGGYRWFDPFGRPICY